MYAKKGRNRWILFVFILAGMVLGASLSHYLSRYPAVAWLDFGQRFGITSPATLSLGILSVTFGFDLRINIGGLIGIALGIVAYKLSDRL